MPRGNAPISCEWARSCGLHRTLTETLGFCDVEPILHARASKFSAELQPLHSIRPILHSIRIGCRIARIPKTRPSPRQFQGIPRMAIRRNVIDVVSGDTFLTLVRRFFDTRDAVTNY